MMKKNRKATAVLTTLLIIVCGMLVLGRAITGQINKSAAELLLQIPSPNKEHTAYLYTFDMGATTQKSYLLTVLKSDQKFRFQRPNTFSSYEEFSAEWLDNATLCISGRLSDDAALFQSFHVGKVKIHYHLPTQYPNNHHRSELP